MKKKKSANLRKDYGGQAASQIKVVKEKRVKIIEPEAILQREIALEDRDLCRAKVAEILEGFREDREKRKKELRKFMGDLKKLRSKRREEMQKYMQNLRSRVLDKKKKLPIVKV